MSWGWGILEKTHGLIRDMQLLYCCVLSPRLEYFPKETSPQLYLLYEQEMPLD